ncbi:hypothetical protein J4465_01370 [Candidatus Pacearchaeota archaeon]|nr:hypothetical protein [Candidatus Pacearchaeota archaeon]
MIFQLVFSKAIEMKDKEIGNEQGEAKKDSAQLVRNSRLPYISGLTSTTAVFNQVGKLEKIIRINENRFTLKINFGEGKVASVDYKGVRPRKYRGHSVLIYEEVRAGREKRIQIWDQTTGAHYYGVFG